MNKNAFLLLCAVFIAVFGCVDPLSMKITTRKEILIIEGDINDFDSVQVITITKNLPSSFNIRFAPVPDATVEVIENGNIKYLCVEGTPGKYILPAGFKGKVNATYQLSVRLSEGKSYLSTAEVLNPVPEITNLFARVQLGGVEKNGTKVDGHHIYLNTRDTPDHDDFYAWEWKSYERQYYCYTCEGGLYNRTPLPEGSCTTVAALQRQGTIYDYACEGQCWDIYRSEQINIMSDRFSNGGEIKNRLIAQIPYYHDIGTLVEITQRAVTPLAFGYLDMVADQSQNSGSLADTPPAALVGNIRNTEDRYESVGGFFMVGGVRRKLFWLDRKDLEGTGARAIGLLGRTPTMEPPNMLRPPQAFCVDSFRRTPRKPDGWID